MTSRTLFDYPTKYRTSKHSKQVIHYKILLQFDNNTLYVVMFENEPEIVFGDNLRGLLPNDFFRIRRFYSKGVKRSIRVCLYYNQHNPTIANLARQIHDWFDIDTLRKNARNNRFSENIYNLLNDNDFEIYVEPEKIYQEDPKVVIDKATEDKAGIEGVAVSTIARHTDEVFYWTRYYAWSRGVIVHTFDIDRLRKYQRKPMLYVVNNIVQLYAKADGIPWNLPPEVLRDGDLVIGFAFSREDSEYIIGSVFAINVVGRTLRTYAFGIPISVSALRVDSMKIPPHVFAHAMDMFFNNIWTQIPKGLAKVKRVFIYKTNPIHPDEVDYLKSSSYLKGVEWYLIHYAEHAFRKRLFIDIDGRPYALRNLLLVDLAFNRITLTPRGNIVIRSDKGDIIFRKVHTLGTPRSVDLEVVFSRDLSADEVFETLLSIAYQYLALTKIDWEAASNWPKRPMVIKYALRIARMIKYVGVPPNIATITFRDVRFLM